MLDNPFAVLERRLNRIESLITSLGQELQSQQKEEVLEVEDVCRMFGVSRTTVYEWRRSGKVPSYHRGRRVYFKKSELLRFRKDEIEAQEKGGEI
ncbi:helix-turn-helix domain-containing protein [Cesiribacter sp. SM1]|uniref:helix-turn-helix domain-containing protein n=1 Tax=Cesiribacter sp. SM1 TaxID=2861196 RepID=UPI001CD5BB3F|nr:helix-turn-helix domain-containing protein [Cesiribacter sp. SM1]